MKISRLLTVGKNCCRRFSFKYDMTPASRFASDHIEEPLKPEEPPKPPTPPVRYTLYQPRSSGEKPNINDLQKRSTRTVAEESVFENVVPQEGLSGETSLAINRFQVSKTYANATLPLKSVKLANPFPEPVKMMMSRTVSDYEKAEQMLADSKNQMNHASSNKICANLRSFSTGVKRWYSKSVKEELGKGQKVQFSFVKLAPKPKVVKKSPEFFITGL